MSESLLDPALVWGLVPRFIGLMYVVAFGSLIPQVERQIGSRGISPVATRLACVRRDFPGLRRFLEYPTLLWLNSNDRTIVALPWLGLGCGLCLIFGGPLAPWALALAWLLWLSLEPAFLVFPWDTMLQELGFLALFLPTPEPWPSLLASTLPDPAVAFVLRFFVLRLMWGFAKVKFIKAEKQDVLYLRGFFVWLPLPSPLGWFGHHAPRWALTLMMYFMFLAEVIAPGLGFFTGLPRIISFVLLLSLMVGIQATGNWGFFNIGYALTCVCLLDTQSSLFDLGQEPWASTLWQWPQVGIHAVMALLFLTGLVNLVLADSWITRTWMHWPLDELVWNRRWARALLKYFRALAPLRIVNGYGVFPPHSMAPIRIIPVFEGSDDGVNWKAYRYRFMPTRPKDRPPFVAPHHPRFDKAVIYAAVAAHDGSFYASLIGEGTPYAAWNSSSWLERAAQRLAEGEPLLARAFRHNPFPDRPPKYVRVSAVAMTPARLDEWRATGNWWHVRRVGTLVPARPKESWVFQHTYPEPERFHPDWLSFRRRSKTLRAITQAFEAGADPEAAVLIESDFTRDEVQRFWERFIPRLAADREDFAHHRARALSLREEFGVAQLHRFERILERFAWLLRLRTERHHYADARPKIPLASNFRYHMLLHEIVLDGRDAYLQILADPALAAARAERTTDASQLRALSVLRADLMHAHICAFRWFPMARDNYELKIPGLWEYYPLLSAHVPPEEDYRPASTMHPDGEHTIEDFYPPPSLLSARESCRPPSHTAA